MWAIVFNGKIETENPDLVLEKFQTILKETDSDFIGRVERYQLAEYVDYQKVEPVTVVNDGSETEGTQDSNI
jgi:hypothetical protein